MRYQLSLKIAWLSGSNGPAAATTTASAPRAASHGLSPARRSPNASLTDAKNNLFGFQLGADGVAYRSGALSVEGGTVNTTGIKAGDVITHASDSTNKYVVNTGLTAASGDIVIGSPGLKVAGADADEITIGANYTANVLFHQACIELAMRAPAKPFGGDAAVDVMVVQDPHSGLVFEISVYKAFNKAMIYVGAVWGKKAWKPDGIAVLMG